MLLSYYILITYHRLFHSENITVSYIAVWDIDIVRCEILSHTQLAHSWLLYIYIYEAHVSIDINANTF